MTSVVVTHDMSTARKVADRIIMLYPLFRLGPDEPQIVFDGTPAEMEGRAPRDVTRNRMDHVFRMITTGDVAAQKGGRR